MVSKQLIKGGDPMSQYIYGPMDGATENAAGTLGLVPRPAAGDQEKVLKGDGTWGTIIDDESGEGDTGSTWSADKLFNDLSVAELEEVQEIIDSYDDEEDEGMIVEMALSDSGWSYISDADAADIATAFMAGKNVVFHFPAQSETTSDAYMRLAYYAPASEGTPAEAFAVAHIQGVIYQGHNEYIQLNYPNVNSNGKLEFGIPD